MHKICTVENNLIVASSQNISSNYLLRVYLIAEEQVGEN